MILDERWLNEFVTLMVILDPPGLIPIFLGLTVGMNSSQQRQTALTASVIALCLLAVFALGGAQILAALGISTDAFRIAGGILLFYIAFEMIFEKRQERKQSTVKTALTRDNIRNIAAFPLAMPLIAGPGTISATVLMAGRHHDVRGILTTLFVLCLVILICYGVMLLASPIERLIGSTGRSILTRLFGVLLSAVAVQFVVNGLRALAWPA